MFNYGQRLLSVTVWLCNFSHIILAQDLSCAQYSSRDSDDFWASVGRCPSCTNSGGCGFCESTLQCLSGTASGPADNSPCPSWSFEENSCPIIPNCENYLDCAGCASQDQCAWCASESLCTTISDAFSRDCRGLIFEPPCPDKFVSGKIFFSGSALSKLVCLVHFLLKKLSTFFSQTTSLSGILSSELTLHSGVAN